MHRRDWFKLGAGAAGLPERSVAASLAEFERLIMAVKGQGGEGSKIGGAQDVLRNLSLKEGIPLAFIGGLGAIYHGYERTTNDIDVVVPRAALDAIIRIAPKYRIKVIWQNPDGWHKLHFAGVDIDVVPEGGKPQRHLPSTIPGPKQLGVAKGADYAALPGWVETKLASNRIQDRPTWLRSSSAARRRPWPRFGTTSPRCIRPTYVALKNCTRPRRTRNSKNGNEAGRGLSGR